MALYLGDKLISSNLAGGDTNPIGSVIAFAGANAPVGYLMCDGSAVSRETYADLFSVIGTTYGSGDGSTTFNLPDIIEYQTELVWENPNPSAQFAEQTLNINSQGWVGNEHTYYDGFDVRMVGHPYSYLINKTQYSYQRDSFYLDHLYDSTASYMLYRRFEILTTGIHFLEAQYKKVDGSSRAQNNSALIPEKIYGIKETTPIIKATHNVTIQGVDTMSEAEYQDLLERLV